MADLLGKVVKRSQEGDAPLPMSDRATWQTSPQTTGQTTGQPQLGMNAFDPEWLGSAKQFILPLGSRDRGGDGDGQMQEFNLDVLDGKNTREGPSFVEEQAEQGASGSGTQGTSQESPSRRNADELERPRAEDVVYNTERKDKSPLGISVSNIP